MVLLSAKCSISYELIIYLRFSQRFCWTFKSSCTLRCIAEQSLTFRSLLVFQALREDFEDECFMNLPNVGKYLHGVTCQITWNLQSTVICDVSPCVLIQITEVSGEHTASIFRAEDGGSKFLLTLLNFYQNARRLFLQDILHSLNGSVNISINSGEIYLPVLPALYESNVNNWCTLLVFGEAKNSLRNPPYCVKHLIS